MVQRNKANSELFRAFQKICFFFDSCGAIPAFSKDVYGPPTAGWPLNSELSTGEPLRHHWKNHYPHRDPHAEKSVWKQRKQQVAKARWGQAERPKNIDISAFGRFG